MNIYKYLDYRKFLAEFLKKHNFSQRKVANATNIHVAYFSRVLKGEMGANFSEDQLYAICQEINLIKEEEMSYLFLLLQYERGGNNKYKQHLKKKIIEIRQEKLSIKGRIDGEESAGERIFAIDEKIELKYKYFQKWYYTEIYLLLSIELYRKNLNLISSKLHLPMELVMAVIADLEEMGLVERMGSEIKYIQKVIHMGEHHFLATNHHVNWRMRALDHIAKTSGVDTSLVPSSGWHFTVGISTNKETILEIDKRFKDFVHEIYLLTRNSKESEETYHICIDLF